MLKENSCLQKSNKQSRFFLAAEIWPFWRSGSASFYKVLSELTEETRTVGAFGENVAAER